jgi:nucleoside phosphorylase
VSTKLPFLGHDNRTAKITSGNTTTRLLGIFQKVEHVLLVGCGGGVPNYTDGSKHSRRGDIVVSWPGRPSSTSNDQQEDQNEDFIYAHFEIQKNFDNSQIISKSWLPASLDLYQVVNDIRKTYNPKLAKKYPWEVYLEEGISSLRNSELDCRRPNEDKLFFNVGDKNIIEVSHPEDENDRQRFGQPTVRFGKIGGGDKIVKDDNLRHLVSEQYNIKCFDTDIDQVMESIEGNRKDSFIVIRSIVDYSDGTTSKEWHPYAALSAAAFTKAIICALPPATTNSFY